MYSRFGDSCTVDIGSRCEKLDVSQGYSVASKDDSILDSETVISEQIKVKAPQIDARATAVSEPLHGGLPGFTCLAPNLRVRLLLTAA